MNSTLLLLGWAALLLPLGPFHLHIREGQDSAESLQRFVQTFYDWYVPIARASHQAPAWDLALKQKSTAFSAELARALREDSVAQSKSVGQIVGLDFDPFLNSQDPGNRYEVGGIANKGGTYWVDIFRKRSDTGIRNADVVAELTFKDGHWFFVNFHYPKGADLLGILRLLREARRKPPDGTGTRSLR